MRRILIVAALIAAVMGITAITASAAPSAKKATLKVNAGQKQALKKGGLKVKVKGLTSGKVKLKARSSTFDDQTLRKLTTPKKVKAKGKSASTVLKLTAKGRQRISSCEARKIVVSGNGVKKAKVDLKRNTKDCKPKSIDLSQAASCDFIGAQDGSLCLMPFPDDYYTVKDSSTATGRRVNLTDAAMPQNVDNTPVSAAPYNLNDGFSPGQVITLRVPGLDTPEALANTNPIPLNDLSRNESQDSKEPIVVIDAATNKRVPIWVELDSNATSPAGTALLIHGATQFEAGHRYIVAMRKLKDSAGNKLSAPEGFRYYRDDLPSNEDAITSQSKRFENMFRSLRKAKIKRHNLYLAWDFTVASDENIAGRLLHMRDDAFAQLGDTNLSDGVVQGNAPAFSIDSVVEDPNPGQIQRADHGHVHGALLPDQQLRGAGGHGPRRGRQPDPARHLRGELRLHHPRCGDRVLAGRPSLYGHGLLGSAGEVGSSPQRSLAQAHNFVFCATDEIGFASEDIPNTIGILQNLGRFPELTDRVQQGLLNELYLGRLMDNDGGFVSDAAFHADGATLASPPVIDTSKLYYDGNSQGGILGGALTAVSPDFTRASLGVPAMGYSTLLTRSIDFDDVLDDPVPGVPERALTPAGAVAGRRCSGTARSRTATRTG